MHNANIMVFRIIAFFCLSISMANNVARASERIVDYGILSKKSDLILVGTIKHIKLSENEAILKYEDIELKCGIWNANIIVEGVIKGDEINPSIILEYLWLNKGNMHGNTEIFGELEHFNGDETVVLFLQRKKDAPNVYGLTEHYKSAIRISLNSAVKEQLKRNCTPDGHMSYITSLLSKSLGSLPIEATEEALSELAGLDKKEASRVSTMLVDQSKDSAIKGYAHDALFHIGDYSRAKEAIEYLSSEDNDDLVENIKKGLSYTLSNIKNEEIVLNIFSALLRSPKNYIRRDVTYAIRNLKSQRAIPLLINGLSDKDVTARYNCNMGLASVTGTISEWGTSFDLFKDNEQKYIKHWLDWWNEGRREKISPAEKEQPVKPRNELTKSNPSGNAVESSANVNEKKILMENHRTIFSLVGFMAFVALLLIVIKRQHRRM